jgi:ERCC4-related helicase
MAGVGPAPKALRGYQQRAVNRAATGCNMILVGPTGSGKTAIPVAHAEAMLRLNPAARVVFLAPTVPLVQQQTGKGGDSGQSGYVSC